MQEVKKHLKHSMSGFSTKNDLGRDFIMKNVFNIAVQLSVQEGLKSSAGKSAQSVLTTGKRNQTKADNRVR